MNFSGLGGVTLFVVAILWLFVFIPSWHNASVEKSKEQTQVREVKQAFKAARKPITKAPKTKVASLSEQVYRAEISIRALTFLVWMFSATTVLLGFALTRFGFLVAELIVAVIATLATARGLAMAKAHQRKLLLGSIKSRAAATSTAMTANARASAETAAEVRLAQAAHRRAALAAREWAAALEAENKAREFTVEPIPAPTYTTQVGSLEAPEFAEVVDLEPKTTQPIDAETITEILRRRRASNQ